MDRSIYLSIYLSIIHLSIHPSIYLPYLPSIQMLTAAGAVELTETESAVAVGFSEEEAEQALKAVADAL